MNKHRTPKDMKVADVRDSALEYFIRGFVVPFHNNGYVLSEASSPDCFSLKMFGEG